MPETTPSPEALLRPEVHEIARGQTGQRPRVTHHPAPMFFNSQAVDPSLPGPPFQHIILTFGGVMIEEGDDPGDASQIDDPPVLPVPDDGGSHADLSRDIFLVQKTEFQTATAQVVAGCGRFLGKLGRSWNFQGKSDPVSRIGRFRKGHPRGAIGRKNAAKSLRRLAPKANALPAGHCAHTTGSGSETGVRCGPQRS